MADFAVGAAEILGVSPNDGLAIKLTLTGAAGLVGTLTYDFGWTAPTSVHGNNPDTDTPAGSLAVTRAGYEVSGGSVGTTTRARTLYLTKEIAKVYPDHAEVDETVNGADLEVIIAVSGYVYKAAIDSVVTLTLAAGTITDGVDSNLAATALAVTNSSTKEAPKVKAAWIDPPGGRVGATCTDRISAAHPSGVAAVLFTITDESAGTVTEIVETQELFRSDRYGTALPGILGFQCGASMATLTDTDGITVRAQVYPFDGDSATVFDSNGETNAHRRNRVHRLDVAGTLPQVYAYVDIANGGAGTVSATAATARAAPYSDFWTAVKAARDFINTNYSVANSLDGAIIRLMDNAGAAQDHYWGRTGFATEMTAPWEFARIQKDPLATGTVRIVDRAPSTPTNNILCQKVRIEDLPIAPASGNQTNYFASVGADDWYVMIRSDMNLSNTSSAAVLFASTVEGVTTYDCGHDGWYPNLRGNNDVWPDISGKESTAVWAGSTAGSIMGWTLDCVSDSYQATTEPTILTQSGAVSNRYDAFFEFTTVAAMAFNAGSKTTNCYMGFFIARRYDQAGAQPLVRAGADFEDCFWEHYAIIGQRFNAENEAASNIVYDRFITRAWSAPYVAYKYDVYGEDGTLTGARSWLYGVDKIGTYNGLANSFPAKFDGLHAFTATTNADYAQANLNTDATPDPDSEIVGLLKSPYNTAAYHMDGPATYSGGPIGPVGLAAPTISSIDPTSGAVGASGVLTINGTGFVDGAVATANIGVVALGTTNFISSTQLTVTNYTVNGVGTSDITVTNPDEQAVTSVGAFTGTAAANTVGSGIWHGLPGKQTYRRIWWEE